jgi:hypothetical protein
LVEARGCRATTDLRISIQRLAVVVLACYCISFFGGCGIPTKEPPLPQLQMPGIVRLDGLTSIQAQLGVHRISSLTTYLEPAEQGGTGRTRVVASIGHGTYDMALDGTPPVKLSTEDLCNGEISASADGQLAVCRTSAGVSAFPLTASPAPVYLLLVNSPSESTTPVRYIRAALSPDGARLAVVARGTETLLALYSIAPVTHAVQLVATLSLTQAAQAGRFATVDIDQPVWSPDGHYIAFTIISPADTNIHLLRVAPFLLSTFATGRAPRQIPVTTEALVKIPANSTSVPLSWSVDSASLIYVNFQGDSIERVTIATGRTVPLFSQQLARICYAVEVPNEHALLFDLCRRVSEPEALAPIEQLYLYSGDE